jgi:Uma2 family endonuclease
VSAQPYDRCRYTVEEFAALPEDNSMRYELLAGRIVASPRPALAHMVVVNRLYTQIDAQLPDGLLVVSEIDLDLELSPPVVRIPDLVIVDARVAGESGLVKASDVVLAVEVFSPSSLRSDTKVKPLEYAAAGIPNLWLIDPVRPVTVVSYRLVGGDYEESQRAVHTLRVSEPCALHIDLDLLLPEAFD